MSTLYEIINILPFSLITVMLAGAYAGMPEESAAGYVICLAVSVWILLLRGMNGKNRLRSTGVVSVFIIGLILVAGEENRQLFAENYMWTVRIAGISAAAVAVGILMNRYILIKRIITAALFVCSIAGTISGHPIGKEAFSLICFILLVRITEEIQMHWNKAGSTDIREHTARISPLLLAVCLLAYIFPSPDKPYDWQFAKAVYRYTVSCVNRFYGYIAHPSDDYGSTGFSDKGSFIGGLNGNDEEVLIISSNNTTIKDLRLVGCMSGDFTGREWKFDTESDSFFRMADTMETYCAVMRYEDAPM